MNNLIQSITAYTTALEQKLSALEVRVAQLEQQLEEANETMRRLGERLEAKGEWLEDPEIEILKEKRQLLAEELDRLETLEITDDAPISTEEPVVELEPEPVVEEPAPAPILELEPVVEPEPVVIPVEPTPQAVVEVVPVVESAPVIEKPAPRPTPTQTSLFGSAVEDIRQAISLGDRFLFQRELFAGNGELMQKTLDELNALGSLSEAMDYVLDNFEWDKESTAVQLFENVLKRRFS
ncbi:MAG: hypothetical protein IKW35_09500 [Paludibacteraceae bacterium]|nr:hypothetical protein [Paludibacteraceae bacterium]